MERKDSIYAVYSEKVGRLELFNDNAHKEEERKIEGNVYINHQNKEIRLYNFRKSDLSNEEKVEIICSILEELVLFPKSLVSKEYEKGKIEEYTLMIGGYLLNGEFKDNRKKYPSIVTELIDNTKIYDGESPKIEFYIMIIKDFYKENTNYLGKKNIVLEINSPNLVRGYIDYVNISRLLSTYLKDKGIKFAMGLNNKIFCNNKKIYIMPIKNKN